MSRRPFLGLAVLVLVGALFTWRQRSRSAASTDGSPFHPTSPELIATTGRPQLLEFFHKA